MRRIKSLQSTVLLDRLEEYCCFDEVRAFLDPEVYPRDELQQDINALRINVTSARMEVESAEQQYEDLSGRAATANEVHREAYAVNSPGLLALVRSLRAGLAHRLGEWDSPARSRFVAQGQTPVAI